MLVKDESWKPFGAGRLAGVGSIADSALAARLLAYKQTVASAYKSVAPCDIRQSIPSGHHLVSKKVDGECWFLHASDGIVHLLSPSGRALTGIALTDEAARLIGKREFLLAGELYATPTSGSRPRVYDLMSALGGEAPAPERLRFAAFDVLSLDRENVQGWPFSKKAHCLKQLLADGVNVHPVDFTPCSSHVSVSAIFNQVVTQNGDEGLVVKLEDGRTLKVKPEINIDAVVVGYAENEEGLYELLLALQKADGEFILIGRVSMGLSRPDKRELLQRLQPTISPSGYMKATDHRVLYRWVRPELVVEVKCNDLLTANIEGRLVQRMHLQYGQEGWLPLGLSPSVSMLNAVFLRQRNDKSISPSQCGLRQIECWVVLEKSTPTPKELRPHEIIRREVFRKDSETGTLVRKAVAWKTNKHDANANATYPAYAIFFSDYSPARAEVLKTVLRVAASEVRMHRLVDDWLAENILRGWNAVSRWVSGRLESSNAEYSPVRPSITLCKKATISFGRSASPSFLVARKRLKTLEEFGSLHVEKDKAERDALFSLEIPAEKIVESSRRVANLVRMIQYWKSAEFCVDGEPMRGIEFLGVLDDLDPIDKCRRKMSRCGASSCADTCVLGCERLRLKPAIDILEAPYERQAWWTIGQFENTSNPTVVVDKTLILTQVDDRRNDACRMCPRFNREAIGKKISNLPDRIELSTGWRLAHRRSTNTPVWLWPQDKMLPYELADIRSDISNPSTAGSNRYAPASANSIPGLANPTQPTRQIPSVRYADICGQEVAVEAVRDLVELPLKHAALFKEIGVKNAGGGIILAGPPGTGKTLLAKAVAAEADAHIEIVAGPELLSKWFGESEERLRAVFERARQHAPSIILFDELDGIAPNRGGDSNFNAFIAQFLALLDGIESRGQVFVLATTNRPDDIDPALRRPGRFDRVVTMALPDELGRKALFAHHMKSLRHDPTITSAELAAQSSGMSGAQIAWVCNRAGVLCVKQAIRMETPTTETPLIELAHFQVAIREMMPHDRMNLVAVG